MSDDRITRTFKPTKDGKGQIETVYIDGEFAYSCYVPNKCSYGKRLLDAYKEARTNGCLSNDTHSNIP